MKDMDVVKAILSAIKAEGYDINAILNDMDTVCGPAEQFWDELPKLSNGDRVILDEDSIYFLSKTTLVCKNRQGQFFVK